MQTKARAIYSQTGIGRKIGGRPELTTDTLIIADRRGNSTDLKVKVFRIIGGLIVNAESGGDQSQSTENPPDMEQRTIRISSLRMTPVELPYVPILLNVTFITALWDTGAERFFISEEVYRRYFSYRPHQKTKDRVVADQGAPCCHLDHHGLTHVLYHEIDTGDQRPVLSRPYRYDRVKQGIIDYHFEKMLQEGTIRPIQSPYASPVVLTRKNNGLPPDSPEAYRFAIDYRKLNAITKYP
ncbi:uncharacterized protein TNCV_305111 [Trichonephila clavipes]|nr:uncharacterized protein TNCV_305111 [Trichonephila clavipes]